MAVTPDLGTVLGLLGVGFCFLSLVMKHMVSLRVLALVGNVCFLAYGVVAAQLPALVLNAALLPVNAWRLREITKLSKEIVRATKDSPVSQWLLPHMSHHSFKAGEVLFHKGQAADKLIYIASGNLKLAEIGQRIGPGELIGEIGLFSPEKQRTQTLVGETDGELYDMTDEMIFQLYYQNPKLGFFLMRLLAERLLKDVKRGVSETATAQVGGGPAILVKPSAW